MLSIPDKLIHIHQIKIEDPTENLIRFFSDEPKPSKLITYLNSITLKPGIHYAIRGLETFYLTENESIPNPNRQNISILRNRIKNLIEENINEMAVPSGKYSRVDWIDGGALICSKSLDFYERDNLYIKGINPITNFLGAGLILFGQQVVTKKGICSMVEYDFFKRKGKINSDFLKLIKET